MANLTKEQLVDWGFDMLDEQELTELSKAACAELELRVGAALSDGMSDRQLDEFGALVDGDAETALAWTKSVGIVPEDDPVFVVIQNNFPEDRVMVEWACQAWLSHARPDYRRVVAECLAELQEELIEMARKQRVAC